MSRRRRSVAVCGMSVTLGREEIGVLSLVHRSKRTGIRRLDEVFGIASIAVERSLRTLRGLKCVRERRNKTFLGSMNSFTGAKGIFGRGRVRRGERVTQGTMSFVHRNRYVVLSSNSAAARVTGLLARCGRLAIVAGTLGVTLVLNRGPNVALVIAKKRFGTPALSLAKGVTTSSLGNFRTGGLFLTATKVSPSVDLACPDLDSLVMGSTVVGTTRRIVLMTSSSGVKVDTFTDLKSVAVIGSFVASGRVSGRGVRGVGKGGVGLLVKWLGKGGEPNPHARLCCVAGVDAVYLRSRTFSSRSLGRPSSIES